VRPTFLNRRRVTPVSSRRILQSSRAVPTRRIDFLNSRMGLLSRAGNLLRSSPEFLGLRRRVVRSSIGSLSSSTAALNLTKNVLVEGELLLGTTSALL